MSEITAIAAATPQHTPELAMEQIDVQASSDSRPMVVAQAPPVEDVVQFEKLVAPGVEAPAANVVRPTGEGTGMGDVILDSIDKFSSTYQDKIEGVQGSLDPATAFDTQGMMKLQFELMQMHLLQDIVAKVADKTSQGVQTLFKNQ